MNSIEIISDGRNYKLKKCLRCQELVVLERFTFLCTKCRKANENEFDWGRYIDHSKEVRLEARRHG